MPSSISRSRSRGLMNWTRISSQSWRPIKGKNWKRPVQIRIQRPRCPRWALTIANFSVSSLAIQAFDPKIKLLSTRWLWPARRGLNACKSMLACQKCPYLLVAIVEDVEALGFNVLHWAESLQCKPSRYRIVLMSNPIMIVFILINVYIYG